MTDYVATLEKEYGISSGTIRVLLTEQGYSYSGGADNQACCKCSLCNENYKIYGVTGVMTRFLNKVAEVLEKHYDECTRIPMMNDTRSLNLSNSVCVGVYEGLRQLGYPNLQTEGEIPKR